MIVALDRVRIVDTFLQSIQISRIDAYNNKISRIDAYNTNINLPGCLFVKKVYLLLFRRIQFLFNIFFSITLFTRPTLKVAIPLLLLIPYSDLHVVFGNLSSLVF